MVMAPLIFQAENLEGTEALGQALATELPAGAVVALSGTLGAGKTRLVQAVAAASGVERRDVTSPTFVLVNEYRGRRPIYHFDAYRIKDDDEFLQLGPEEYFERQGLTFVEWADRVASQLPAEHVAIHCEATGESVREFTLRATCEPLEGVLRAVAEDLGAA